MSTPPALSSPSPELVRSHPQDLCTECADTGTVMDSECPGHPWVECCETECVECPRCLQCEERLDAVHPSNPKLHVITALYYRSRWRLDYPCCSLECLTLWAKTHSDEAEALAAVHELWAVYDALPLELQEWNTRYGFAQLLVEMAKRLEAHVERGFNRAAYYPHKTAGIPFVDREVA